MVLDCVNEFGELVKVKEAVPITVKELDDLKYLDRVGVGLIVCHGIHHSEDVYKVTIQLVYLKPHVVCRFDVLAQSQILVLHYLQYELFELL